MTNEMQLRWNSRGEQIRTLRIFPRSISHCFLSVLCVSAVNPEFPGLDAISPPLLTVGFAPTLTRF